MDNTLREIINASNAIDKALLRMDKSNRGETAQNIVSIARNLNDNIALKIWRDVESEQPMSVNKAANKFINKSPYQFIGRFDKFLQKSVSHFTPNEDGSERLMLKYYRYLSEHKKVFKKRYDIEIIKNINKFLLDIDEQTKDYYNKVAKAIDENIPGNSNFDNYYITRIKPFFVNQDTYYEVTLEPATEKPNKFNRITAFSKHEMTINYSVALRFAETTINLFDIDYPIRIVTDWKVSIRPCEIQNFAKVLNRDISIERNNHEYQTLMDYMTESLLTLIDVVDFDDEDYNKVKSTVVRSTKEKKSKIFDLLDECREIFSTNSTGTNIIRYLLNKMRNRIIKEQKAQGSEYRYDRYALSRKCRPFDEKPFSFNPKSHVSNLNELLECISAKGREAELLARKVNSNTAQNSILYTALSDLPQFGNADEIKILAKKYNCSLFYKFRPDAELDIYGDYIFNKGYENKLVFVINRLKDLSKQNSDLNKKFTRRYIEKLRNSNDKEKLDDLTKVEILTDMFKRSRVRFIYGAAGTGKSTLINHIAKLMSDKKRIFIAKTNPAVENLRHKVTAKSESDEFITIDKFTKNNRYRGMDYDLIVVDECSTVKNEEIAKIIDLLGNGVLVLIGDVYQIQAIGFGNWFHLAKEIMPDYCCSELTVPYRSTDLELIKFWKEVRNIKEDNLVLEELVRNSYSHIIDKTIFDRKSDDEIILCLNYNGLYGLNNINRLLQIGNGNKAVNVGLWQFKNNDPILFNDSERFEILYNNLKGRIIDMDDRGVSVYFKIEVDIELTQDEVKECRGLTLHESFGTKSIVGFVVNRRRPFSSDNEETNKDHILPFQVAYAVSIHKSQGLEYESVKIVIADDSEDKITHSVFYTAVTRATKFLTLYWSPEVCDRVLKQMKLPNDNKDYFILTNKNNLLN